MYIYFKLNRNLWPLCEIQFCLCLRSFYMPESKHVSIHIYFRVLYIYEICNISAYNVTNSWFFSWSPLILLQSLTHVSTVIVLLSVTELGGKGVELVKWPLSEIMLAITASVQYDEEPAYVDNTDRHITNEIICLYALFEN